MHFERGNASTEPKDIGEEPKDTAMEPAIGADDYAYQTALPRYTKEEACVAYSDETTTTSSQVSSTYTKDYPGHTDIVGTEASINVDLRCTDLNDAQK